MRTTNASNRPTKRAFCQQEILKLMTEGVEVTGITLADKVTPILMKSYSINQKRYGAPRRHKAPPHLVARDTVFKAIRDMIANGQLVLVRLERVGGTSVTTLRLPVTSSDTPPATLSGHRATLEAFQAAAKHYLDTRQFHMMGIR